MVCLFFDLHYFTDYVCEVRLHLNNKNKWILFCIVFDLH